MKIGVLGTGVVGDLFSSKLIELGHEVFVGSRDVTGEKAIAIQNKGVAIGSYEQAAVFGDIVVNGIKGTAALQGLGQAGAKNLAKKVLIDISNPFEASQGYPPHLFIDSTDSLGEQIQRKFPDTKVVKTLNTMDAHIMVEPSLLPQSSTVFMCGDDSDAKAQVTSLLADFGWPAEQILDLGGIIACRGTEAFNMLWVFLNSSLATTKFSVAVIHR